MRDPRGHPSPIEVTWLVALFLGGTALLLVSLSLEPDPRGFGTHTQLGMSTCGYRTRTGVPCPTCGMTTSFAHFARLEVVDAVRVQPFGAALFALTALSTVLALFHLAAWRSPRRWVRRIPSLWIVIALGTALLLGSWAWTRSRS